MNHTSKGKKATERQKEVFDYYKENYPCTLQSIADHFGIYIYAIVKHMRALVKKGYLTYDRFPYKLKEINETILR